MRDLKLLWDWFWYGRICPRCGEERTGHWGRWVTGVPFDEWICETCRVVKIINRVQEDVGCDE